VPNSRPPRQAAGDVHDPGEEIQAFSIQKVMQAAA
jgi:hypothetical protein